MPEGNAPLQQRAELKVQASRVRALAWHPERADSAVTVEERSVVQWRFEGASAEARLSSFLVHEGGAEPNLYPRASATDDHARL